MKENEINEINIEKLYEKAIEKRVEDVAPNFRRRTTLNDEQIRKIVALISVGLGITHEKALVGMTLLFLQGAASAGAPTTMSVDLGEGKSIAKRDIITACEGATGHKYIRRVAETLASSIGNFAYQNKLTGELGYRINNKHKAETGEGLTDKELAYCSSFSQAIPNLSELVSERLSKVLAEDYQRRFENKKKQKVEQANNKNKKRKR